jgi:hypothetical protein
MKYILFVLLVISFSVSAQVPVGARLAALNEAGVALQDHWSARSNQAGLSNIDSIVVGLNYEQRFEDVNTQSAVLICPWFKSVFAFAFSSYGFSEYKEQQVSLAASKKWDDISLGVGINYHQLNLRNYGSASALSVDVGCQYSLSDKIILGAHISNPSGSKFPGELTALLPVSIDFGSSFHITDKLLITSEIEKVLRSVTSLKVGAEYKIIEWFAIRAGMSSNPLRQSIGFGVAYHKFHFDAASYSQNYLGFIPQVGLSYEF